MRPCSVSTRNMRPGCRRPLRSTSCRREIEHADFGSHDDQVVLGDVVARRPQAVAIQHRADLPAVGEGDRGRAIPGLHQAGVVLVEGALAHRSCSRASATAPESSSSRHAAANGRPAPAAPACCRTWPNRCRSDSRSAGCGRCVAEQLRLVGLVAVLMQAHTGRAIVIVDQTAIRLSLRSRHGPPYVVHGIGNRRP